LIIYNFKLYYKSSNKFELSINNYLKINFKICIKKQDLFLYFVLKLEEIFSIINDNINKIFLDFDFFSDKKDIILTLKDIYLWWYYKLSMKYIIDNKEWDLFFK
jgi:hypothetical protein